MVISLIQQIAQDLEDIGSHVILVDNADAFLLREDIAKELEEKGIKVITGSRIELRLAFELRQRRFPDHTLLLVTKNKEHYLEDMLSKATNYSFHLSSYLSSYHLETLLNCEINILNQLFNRNDVLNFTKSETETLIEEIKETGFKQPEIDMAEHKVILEHLLKVEKRDWLEISKHLAKSLSLAIDTAYLNEIINDINYANSYFQQEIIDSFKQTINSNPFKKPKVVSKVLDFLAAHYLDKQVALIIVDGMAFWQYLILKQEFPTKLQVTDDFIYSWIPSITQLSRQAIFRGSTPLSDYVQNPPNEERLWRNYWLDKKLSKYEVKYDYQESKLEELNHVTKYALVFKDLDEKMHSSSDYIDLEKLTRNWVKRSIIVETIECLAEKGFTIFLTTDHGNIQAKGWRNLKGKEKLGANKSGSRSARHIEYSDKNFADNFLNDNSSIAESLVREDETIYFKDDLSFSMEKSLVTHGGSHIFEVVIPFIKIEK